MTKKEETKNDLHLEKSLQNELRMLSKKKEKII
jgi:hypothetical protein